MHKLIRTTSNLRHAPYSASNFLIVQSSMVVIYRKHWGNNFQYVSGCARVLDINQLRAEVAVTLHVVPYDYDSQLDLLGNEWVSDEALSIVWLSTKPK